jgi:hypothetical protein
MSDDNEQGLDEGPDTPVQPAEVVTTHANLRDEDDE